MKTKIVITAMLCLFLAMGAWADYALSQTAKPGVLCPPDTELCALMLRKGNESFSRARYGEAKDYFHKAVLADPSSQKAWSYYDLALMYTVAEQFKNHGKIVQSTAPQPEAAIEPAAKEPVAPKAKVPKARVSPAPGSQSPSPLPEPAGKAPVEKAKPAPPAPATVAPAPAPAPVKPPGGAKILHDEGC
jgi:hypothetical protein